MRFVFGRCQEANDQDDHEHYQGQVIEYVMSHSLRFPGPWSSWVWTWRAPFELRDLFEPSDVEVIAVLYMFHYPAFSIPAHADNEEIFADNHLVRMGDFKVFAIAHVDSKGRERFFSHCLQHVFQFHSVKRSS